MFIRVWDSRCERVGRCARYGVLSVNGCCVYACASVSLCGVCASFRGVSGEKTCTNVLLAPVQCWFKRFYRHGFFNMEAEVVSLVLYDLELYIRDRLRVRLHKMVSED